MVPGLLLAALALALGAGGGAGEPRFAGEVDVRRLLVEARVVDRKGQPLRGLGPGDFAVRVGGRAAAVESARWVEAGGSAAAGPGAAPGAAGGDPDDEDDARLADLAAALDPPGRRLLFLFQTDLTPSRLSGLYRMSRRARDLIDELGPDDRVAIAVLGTHLRLHLDFTADPGRLRRELEVSRLLAGPPATVARTAGAEGTEGTEDAPGEPSLRPGLDPARARRASRPETALALLAEALAPLPGAKSVVFFGWGIGRLSGGGVHLGRDYALALAALQAARATVFALDLTDADWHSLEVGLQAMAEDTGGFYSRTHLFPAVALRKLAGALAGHYELTLAPPALPAGAHRLEVKVRARGAEVQAPPRIDLGG